MSGFVSRRFAQRATTLGFGVDNDQEALMEQIADVGNGKVDAGDIGADHTVTALYEIAPVGGKGRNVDPLRYGVGSVGAVSPDASEFASLKLPGQEQSRLIDTPLVSSRLRPVNGASSNADFRFAAAAAGSGQILRGGQHTRAFGYRAGFLTLVDLAKGLDRP